MSAWMKQSPTLAASSVLLILAFLVCPGFADEAGVDLSGIRVQHVYVHGQDVTGFLPELVAQVAVPAVIDLGRLIEAGSPLTHRQRTIPSFRFQEGTLKQLLDQLEKHAPSVSWQQAGGVLMLTYRMQGDKSDLPLLRKRVETFECNGSLSQGLSRLENLLETMVDDEDSLVVDTPYPQESLRWSGTWSRRVYDERTRDDVLRPIDFAGGTVRDLLRVMVGSGNHQLWVVFDGQANELYESSARLLISQSSFNPERAAWDLDTTVKFLLPDFRDQKPYLSSTVRRSDARAELLRRHAFEPDAVVEAIRDAQLIRRLVVDSDDYIQALAMFDLLKDMGDPAMLAEMVAAVRALPVAEDDGDFGKVDKRFALIRAIPDPDDAILTHSRNIWTEISRNDPDPKARRLAEKRLQNVE